MAVPVAATGGSSSWGALVVGGREFDAEDERILRLISTQTASAIEGLRGRARRSWILSPGFRTAPPCTTSSTKSSPSVPARRFLVRGDLDHFRRYNQVYGLPAGDRLLRRIGERFAESQQRVFSLRR